MRTIFVTYIDKNFSTIEIFLKLELDIHDVGVILTTLRIQILKLTPILKKGKRNISLRISISEVGKDLNGAYMSGTI